MPWMPAAATALDPIFKVLADPTRRAVVAHLCRGPASVSELARPFDMALPSFMQHLKQLEAAGLARSTKQGRVRTYTLQPTRLRAAETWLTEQRRLWEARLDQLDAYVNAMKHDPEEPPR